MKFNVQCPRCHGTGKNIDNLPDLPRRRHGTKTEPWKCASRPERGMGSAFDCLAKATRGARRDGGRSLRDYSDRQSIRCFGATGMTFG